MVLNALPPHSPQEARRGLGVVGRHLRGIVTPIYRQTGIAYAELILDWRTIAGPVYGQETRPLRVTGTFPHRCLHIGASRALAAMMVYEVPQLLERIHQYFGKQIVDRIKFEEDYQRREETPSAEPEPIPQRLAPTLQEALSTVPYPPLVQALERLGQRLEGTKV